MLMDLMDDCKISHLGAHCLRQVLYKVDFPRAIEFVKSCLFLSPLCCPSDPLMGLVGHMLTMRVLNHPWGPI